MTKLGTWRYKIADMSMVILDGYYFIVSHNKWRNNVVIITSEIRNEHESEKMFFHVFIFDVYEVELIHQKSKSSTKRYKNRNRKILPNSFSWTGATYVVTVQNK